MGVHAGVVRVACMCRENFNACFLNHKLCANLYFFDAAAVVSSVPLLCSYGVDNGLLCILCARTRQLLQGNMPRAAELSHHVSAATHFSTNVMSLMMASINEMIWCALFCLNAGACWWYLPYLLHLFYFILAKLLVDYLFC